MPLDWKEIANRARAFSKDWRHVESEDADAKSFWDEFFEVFGIKRRKVATFEKRVNRVKPSMTWVGRVKARPVPQA